MTLLALALRRIALVIGATVILLGLWWLFLLVGRISPFIGKTPLDVWTYLFAGPDAGAHRDAVVGNILITLSDTVLGYGVGLLGAVVIAVVFVVAPPVETTFMPVALVLRTFPLIAMAPLIVYGFGRGAGGLAAVGFIVVFFAALVTITFGLRSTPRAALDVVVAHGGGRWARMTKVLSSSRTARRFHGGAHRGAARDHRSAHRGVAHHGQGHWRTASPGRGHLPVHRAVGGCSGDRARHDHDLYRDLADRERGGRSIHGVAQRHVSLRNDTLARTMRRRKRMR